jgi:hypothetical protein
MRADNGLDEGGVEVLLTVLQKRDRDGFNTALG